jgi:hypothetical protein
MQAHGAGRLRSEQRRAFCPPFLFDGNNLALVVFDWSARLFLAPQPKRANLPRGRAPLARGFFVGRLAGRGLSGRRVLARAVHSLATRDDFQRIVR